jgi:hypothetical protein
MPSAASDISSLNSIQVLDPPDEIRANLDDEQNQLSQGLTLPA